MIKLDLATALFFYLFFSVFVVLLLWVLSGYRRKEISYKDDFVWHCSICANTYIDSKGDTVSKCPRCGSYSCLRPSGYEKDKE